ncbi:MAG TPA: MFS transporter [Streptosporangiaceae bacterium]|nr:MFS transporter [Streptosporangiaceae bacterium]
MPESIRSGELAALARAGGLRLIEPWFAPFALLNGAALGLTPILLPVAASRDGVGHVGLVMGAFNLGAFAAPAVGSAADRYRVHRALAVTCAAAMAVSLWLFPVAGPAWQLVLALADGAGFAGAVTVANLLIVERRPRDEWNPRLGVLEAALSVGQGAALFLSSWLATLSERDGLFLAAIVPAAAIPLAAILIPHMARRPAAERQSARQTGGHPPPDAVPPGRQHLLAFTGLVGEWGPASPVRAHHLAHRRPFTGLAALRGPFGWLLAAWIPAYAGTAVIFALYPVLFQHAFGVPPSTSSLAFAVIVLVSLPLFPVAAVVSQRRGPAMAMAGALAARVVLLAALAALASVHGVPAVLPLTAFAGIMFAWSFLSVASPGLTGQLLPGAEGDAQGLLNASSGTAGLVGSVLGGAVAGHLGYAAALAFGAGATALGLVIFVVTTLRHRPAPTRTG